MLLINSLPQKKIKNLNSQHNSPLKILKSNKKIRETFLLHSRYDLNIGRREEVIREEAAATRKERKIRGVFKILRELNYRNALIHLLEEIHPGFMITKKYILNLHKIVMCNFHHLSPGSYRSHGAGLRDERVRFVPPEVIRSRMTGFFKRVNSYDIHPIEKVARIHHKFSLIHPFQDGNGRIGRLIMITQLLSRGLPPPVIESGNNLQRNKYYRALAEADSGDFNEMTDFVFRSMLKGFKILEQV